MIQLSQTLKLEFLKNPSLKLDKNFTRPVSDTTDHQTTFQGKVNSISEFSKK